MIQYLFYFLFNNIILINDKQTLTPNTGKETYPDKQISDSNVKSFDRAAFICHTSSLSVINSTVIHDLFLAVAFIGL